MMRSIGFAEGLLGPKGDDGCFHVYDETIAKQLVTNEATNRDDLQEAYVGLDGDWRENNDLLWSKEEGFQEPYFWKESIWAKPSLLFVYEDGSEKHGGTCYRDESEEEINGK